MKTLNSKNKKFENIFFIFLGFLLTIKSIIILSLATISNNLFFSIEKNKLTIVTILTLYSEHLISEDFYPFWYQSTFLSLFALLAFSWDWLIEYYTNEKE